MIFFITAAFMNKCKFFFYLSLKLATTIFLLLTARASKGQIMNWDKPLGLDSGVHRGVLANGLTYYIVRNTNPIGKIEMSLIVRAGSYHGNKPDDQGVAHFVEHLSFDVKLFSVFNQ